MQTFLTGNENHNPNLQGAALQPSAALLQSSSTPAQNRANFSNPAARPRFQALVPRVVPDEIAPASSSNDAPTLPEQLPVAPVIEEGASESDDNVSDRAEDDGCVDEDVDDHPSSTN